MSRAAARAVVGGSRGEADYSAADSGTRTGCPSKELTATSYTEFHDRLMKATGRLAEDAVVQIAREAGVDVDRMRADMEDPAINESIDRNIEPARAIGVTGTPTFIIGDAMLDGVEPLQEMESAIADARPPSARRP